MNKHLLPLPAIAKAVLVLSSALIFSSSHAQTAPPPSLGEETKGAPAIAETPSTSESATDNTAATSGSADDAESQSASAFGNATVVESRRENGQVYLIELQHANTPTQYIEENDSDGNIEFESTDLEETPNLPKWKLGSW